MMLFSFPLFLGLDKETSLVSLSSIICVFENKVFNHV